MNKRIDGRVASAHRDIKITRNFTKHALGSVLIEYGEVDQIFGNPIDKRTENYVTGRIG